ncbi:hypothetical protein EYF80_013935 [Liparis tanakae]|uniref:Uncharacterized protein n=1 Tax=Liparis tanakae TaxID=230148 RepID=A0A4Z2ICT2_9TELE|nr:hypothetical protein EYF80_013935 [Liparis tanakae]
MSIERRTKANSQVEWSVRPPAGLDWIDIILAALLEQQTRIKNHRGHLHQMLARIIRRVAQGEPHLVPWTQHPLLLVGLVLLVRSTVRSKNLRVNSTAPMVACFEVWNDPSQSAGLD